MNKKWILAIAALLTLTGCSQETTTSTPPSLVSTPAKPTATATETSNTSLPDLIKNEVEKKDSAHTVTGFNIHSNVEVQDGALLMFTYQANDKLQEGLAQVTGTDSFKIQSLDTAVVDSDSPFTVHQISGQLSDGKSSYLLLGGVIQDKKINQFLISFNDGKLVNVKVGDRTTYCYARTDKLVSIKEIQALDEAGTVLFTYPPYPPAKK